MFDLRCCAKTLSCNPEVTVSWRKRKENGSEQTSANYRLDRHVQSIAVNPCCFGSRFKRINRTTPRRAAMASSAGALRVYHAPSTVAIAVATAILAAVGGYFVGQATSLG